MKDDYLWDKSGEPDAEIQHLERVLGQLRNKKNAGEVMRAFEQHQRRKARPYRKVLLMAASLAFLLLALGAFAVIQKQTAQREALYTSIVMASPVQMETTVPGVTAPNGTDEPRQPDKDKSSYEVSITQPRRSLTYAQRQRTLSRGATVPVNSRETAEGMMAKEQLIKALQITSSNLNVVQKKVKGAAPLGPS